MFSSQIAKEIHDSDMADYSIYYDKLSNLEIFNTDIDSNIKPVEELVRNMIETYLITKFDMKKEQIEEMIKYHPLETTYLITLNLLEGMSWKETFDKNNIAVEENK